MGDNDPFDWISELFERITDCVEFVDDANIGLPIRLARVFLLEVGKATKKAREEHRELVQIAVGFARAMAQLPSDDRERLTHLFEQEEFGKAIGLAESLHCGMSDPLVKGIHEVQRRHQWSQRLNVLLNQGKLQEAIEFVQSLRMFPEEKSAVIEGIQEVAPKIEKRKREIEKRKREIEKRKRDAEKWQRKLRRLVDKGRYSKARSYVESLPIHRDAKTKLVSGIEGHELATKIDKRKRDIERSERELKRLVDGERYSEARSIVESLPIDQDAKTRLVSHIEHHADAIKMDKRKREVEKWERELTRLVDKGQCSKARSYVDSLPIDWDTKTKLMSRIDDVRFWKARGPRPPGAPDGFADLLEPFWKPGSAGQRPAVPITVRDGYGT